MGRAWKAWFGDSRPDRIAPLIPAARWRWDCWDCWAVVAILLILCLPILVGWLFDVPVWK